MKKFVGLNDVQALSERITSFRDEVEISWCKTEAKVETNLEDDPKSHLRITCYYCGKAVHMK